MDHSDNDAEVRQAAFRWLDDQVRLHGDVLSRSLLAEGFLHRGTRVPLLGPQGIFKPKIMRLPVSITTIPTGPYDDVLTKDGLLHYRYRGSNPNHPDNAGLREAMRRRIPLVYFYRVVEGKYVAVWPVFIVGDDPHTLTFQIEVDDIKLAQVPATGDTQFIAAEEARRSYITATVKQRLHQRTFRERVLKAYREQCALCCFRHEELLDAAHIIPDSEPEGLPVVPNGIALCKFHHAAFDRQFLAVRPDYVVEIRSDILAEEDGPMLLHGLKDMHLREIFVPRPVELRPDRILLEKRYREFLTKEP